MTKAQILIVEDDGLVAKDIETMLKRLGYDVAGVVMSGEKAVIKATDLQPELILMDIGLRGDMDGIEAAEKIRSRLNIPVVYLTAYGDEDTIQRAKMTKPLGFLSKPIQEDDLSLAIEEALSKSNEEKN